MTKELLLTRVRTYYDACNSGDAERIAACFAPDAVHYYTRLGPHRGARAIAEHTARGVRELQAEWRVAHGIEQGDEAVIEWTMTWSDPGSGARRLDRGTEWLAFDGEGRIREVRAYHHGSPRNRSGDLLGFDHAGRGHTVLP